MRVVFRTDASGEIGSGHVMRCLTLAVELRDSGSDVLFVSRLHAGHFNGIIESSGFKVASLPTGDASAPSLQGYLRWLGVSSMDDAAQTRQAISSAGFERPDWLIVDHYALDKNWETALRSHADKIMVIDDLADRMHDCDLLLDQNLIADFQHRYDGLIPAGATALLGPRFALLQPIYHKLRNKCPPRGRPIQRIFVYFGGSDLHNLTLLAIEAFISLQRSDIILDVVAGELNPRFFEEQIKGHANIHLHSRLPSLAPLMAQADLAIGASGATSWERLCLELPAIVVTLADNQRPIAKELNRRELVSWLGDVGGVSEAVMREAISTAIASPRMLARDASTSVDGLGGQRVLQAMSAEQVAKS